ncbi:glycosyltransferase [Flavobacterium sp. TR2]|uniref:glycosyltransferase n=1 Tax=Flavobacterium sp. TR2 TaxID=2977321 RepID=UPI0021B113CF|nr:glycosyltransferase [Flavobacterium sp. TR2]UWY28613.1 glycosyltransferase [Flavobacterium sp. TR2]
MNKSSIISVCMITYGHEKYIREAIEGVLMQNSDFEIEIILFNDCSPDNTDKIIQDIIKNHERGSWIKYIKHDQNVGMMVNFLQALKACKGDYIALCEGDDYWVDPLKLQKQISFLSSNPHFSLCFHNSIIKSENNERVMLEELGKLEFDTKDILHQWFIPTASIVFRNYSDFVFPDWFVNCQSGDIPLLLLLSLRGNIKYIDEVMSVYRLHQGGVSNTHREYSKVIGMVYIYQSFNFYTKLKFDEEIKNAIIYEMRCHLPEIQELKQLRNNNKSLLKRILVRLKKKLR